VVPIDPRPCQRVCAITLGLYVRRSIRQAQWVSYNYCHSRGLVGASQANEAQRRRPISDLRVKAQPDSNALTRSASLCTPCKTNELSKLPDPGGNWSASSRCGTTSSCQHPRPPDDEGVCGEPPLPVSYATTSSHRMDDPCVLWYGLLLLAFPRRWRHQLQTGQACCSTTEGRPRAQRSRAFESRR